MLWNKNISYRNCINCYIILKKYVKIYLVISLKHSINFTFYSNNIISNDVIKNINNELLNKYNNINIYDYFIDYPNILNCNINKAIESAVSKLLYLYVFLLKQNINDKIKNIKDKIINI